MTPLLFNIDAYTTQTQINISLKIIYYTIIHNQSRKVKLTISIVVTCMHIIGFIAPVSNEKYLFTSYLCLCLSSTQSLFPYNFSEIKILKIIIIIFFYNSKIQELSKASFLNLIRLSCLKLKTILQHVFVWEDLLVIQVLALNTVLRLPSLMVPPICPVLCSGMSITC